MSEEIYLYPEELSIESKFNSRLWPPTQSDQERELGEIKLGRRQKMIRYKHLMDQFRRHKETADPRNGAVSLSPATRGTVTELRVSAHLLEAGVPVFRALSPSCPFDLAILWKRDTLLGVEVRTCTRHCLTKTLMFDRNHQNADLFGVWVSNSLEVVYLPITTLGRAFLAASDLVWEEYARTKEA